MKTSPLPALFLSLLLLLPGGAFAHKASDSYLSLTVAGSTVNGRWDIALRDLDYAIGLDDDEDGNITRAEVVKHQRNIAGYALPRLKLGSGGTDCPVTTGAQSLDRHTDGDYAVIEFAAHCPQPVTNLAVDYTLLFDIDPLHRGLLRLQRGDSGAAETAVMSPEHSSQQFVIGSVSPWSQFGQYLVEGIWHIWTGYDHILFLLSLLLPAVLVYRERRWQPVATFGAAFWDVFKIVTSFTVAHSITLSLAALGLISLPSRLVESAIAFSVLLAALNNIWPLFQGRRWLVAGAFGLIHGFGFASVLADLGLPRDALALALFGFNAGVEIGQLAIVSVFLPLAYLARGSAAYRKGVLLGGSALIALIAVLWLIERALVVEIFTTAPFR